MKNIILLTIDAFRVDHLGCMDYGRQTTPFLDQLGREGVFFRQCISQGPHTPGSMPSMLSSTYPLMYGGEGYLRQDRVMISEILKAEGYATAGVNSNPFLSRYFNYQRGFDYFYDHFRFGRNRWAFLAQRAINVIRPQPYLDAEQMVTLGEQWLASRSVPGPFFLWLHFMDVHGPYQPPFRYQQQFHKARVGRFASARLWRKTIKKPEAVNEAERRTLLDLYDGEIRYTDDVLAQFLDRLNCRGLLGDTVVAVTADHGEEFGEHSGYAHLRSLYDELLRVPFLLWGEGIPAVSPVETQVRSIDIVPTLMDLAGLAPLAHMNGTSLVPVFSGEERADRSAVSEVTGLGREAGTRMFSLRRPPFKLVRQVSDSSEISDRLFHLVHDPCETRDVVSQYPDIAAELSEALYRHMGNYGEGPTDGDGLDIGDDEVKRRLAGLGYVDL